MLGQRQGIIVHFTLLVFLIVAAINVVFAAEIRVKKTVPTASTSVKAEEDKKDVVKSSGRSINDGIYNSLEHGSISVRDDQLTDNLEEESHGVRGYNDGNEYDSPPVHVATYATSGGSKFNPLTVIALSVFGVLAMLILLQLLGVQTFRSMGSSTPSIISLPFEWNFNSEMIPVIMTRVIDWIEKADKNNGTKTKDANEKKDRVKRDMSQTPSLSEWMTAYKKDPYEYECVRKLACETLAHSPSIAKSMKTKLGATIMASLKMFFEDGTMLVETIKDVLEDPDKCLYLFNDFVCEDPETPSAASKNPNNNKL